MHHPERHLDAAVALHDPPAVDSSTVNVLNRPIIGKPLVLQRRPWTVEEVTAERGRTTTLTLRADRHDGLEFLPGQYAWFAIGRSPFALTKHPFSFSSSSVMAPCTAEKSRNRIATAPA